VLAGREVGLWAHQAPSPTAPQGANALGLAQGVAPDGALQVQPLSPDGQAQGEPLLWRMGEVSVRPSPR
jgi:hypothetical protein